MHPYPSGHPRPFPSVATDAQGRIFVCYCSAPAAGSSRNYDPMVTVSTNEGTTWSTPVSANMAVSGDTADQYLPWLCVDPANAVHVVWCDMRNYNNYNGDVYYSYSLDHGTTFSTPEMVNDVTPCLYGSVAANYQGDYNMITADLGRVYVEWCDNRLRGGSNYQDVDASSRDFITGPMHDMGLLAIQTPGPKVDPLTPIAPVVVVENNGTYQETNVPVHFRVDSAGVTVYNNLQTIATLDSAATVQVTFANWTPGPAGNTYNLTAYHSYSPDTNRTNDTLRSTTQTRVHEISSVSTNIGSRVRALSAITPQLTLGNPGDYTERSFNATCWIDSGAVRLYNQTVSVDSVVSGGSKIVSFPAWNTGPVGATYNLTFFNSFSDPNHGNDTLHVATQASNQAKALIAFSDGAANAWALHDTLVARDSSHLFSVIDTFNVSTAGHVLPLSTLINNGYNVVVTWTNNTYSNATAMGDTLAAFMDLGGGVVVGVFADYSGFNITGRYQTQYMPFPLTTNAYTAGTLGTVHLPTHPIMSGISAISVGNYVTGATTMQHGVDVVDFNTGHILAGAFDTVGRRTAELGFFPPTFNYTSWGPQNAHMILNAMCWAAGLCSASGVDVLLALDHLPKIFALAPARPNPTRGTTEIRYQLPTSAPVKIRVYNVAGQLVRTLVDAKQDAGYKSVTWDGRNDRGSHVGPGVYLYRMEAGSFTVTNKMVVVR